MAIIIKEKIQGFLKYPAMILFSGHQYQDRQESPELYMKDR